MKLSDTATSKTLNGRGSIKKNECSTEKASSRRVPNLKSVKVEKPSKGKSSPQSDTVSVVLERKESLRKSRKTNNPDEKAIKERSRSRDYQKPWIPCTRRPSNPKSPPALIDVELSSAGSKQVYKKFPNSPTPDSSDTEKCKRSQNTKVVKNKNGHQTKASISDTTSAKRPKGALTRQLALDNSPSNLKETFSVSDESLNSITSVTQLLKIERSPYSLNGSSNSCAHDNDFEEEEIVTGGVKSLAARWQARTDNTDSSQNGILTKTKSNESRLNNGNGLNDKTSLYEAIRKNLPETNMMMHAEKGQQQEKMKATSMKQSKDWSVTGRISPQQGKPLETKKNITKHSVSLSDDSTSALLTAATVAAAAKPRPPSPERKKVRTKTFPNSSSSPSSSPTALASSSSTRASVVAPTTNKKAEVFSSTLDKNETLNLNKARPRSRSTSPTKSGTFTAQIPASQLTASSTLPESSSSSSSFLSRGRSTNRRSTVDPITPHTNKLTKQFDHDHQQRRSRSMSSTPGLPSYAAATTTSLAKQTNQIKDNQEDFSPTSSRRNSYNKYHSINASNNNTTSNAIIIKSSQNVRGQGQQQKNVAAVIPKKNRIIDSHPSKNKNDPRPKQNTPLKNVITPIKTSCVTATSSPLSSLSLSTSTSLAPQTTQFSSISSQVRKSTAKQNNVKEIKAKLEKGSTKPKSDARMGHHNKNVLKNSEFAAKGKREETNFTSSSFSSSSSSSTTNKTAATLFSKSRLKTKKNERIIPSIIMSEYVDEENKDGKKTVVATNTHRLFTPLQFVEPLEPTCDIEEGSSLELKVRAKGAEAVIWVRENKIIPNAPPDFQYFQEKASDLYGVRIADVFLEDSGLYICEAYGAGGSEKSCWCQVNVFESSSTNEDDDFDISWEDLNMSEEIRSPQPLVVPVIVTSQAEQEREPSPSFETAIAKEMSPIRTVKVKQIDKQESDRQSESLSGILKNRQDSSDYNQRTSSNSSHHKKSSMNESAFTKPFAGAKQIDETAVQGTSNVSRIISKMKSHSAAASFPSSKVTKADYIATNEGVAGETVTEFASVNVTRETRFTYPDEIKNDPITDATTVAVIMPEESDHLTQGDIQDDHDHHDHHHHQQFESGKRKLISELSSASDESIYLKEPRSGDEGVLSSAEDQSASTSLDVKDSVANDEDIPMCTSADSPPPHVGSPCSDQNGRSSSVDSAIGFLGRPLFVDGKFPPRILVGPSNIIALYDETVHLRVKVQNYGIPKTAVNWFKFVNGTYKKIELNSGDQSSSQGEAHISITKCGTSLCTLSISHVNYDDCGRYRVKVQNLLGMDSHDCLLTVEGPPEAPGTSPKVKYDEKSKSILIQWSSCPYDGGSKITGYYVETSVVQGSKTAINRDDIDNWQLLTPQSYSWLCYTLTNPKRGSVYRFRVFGENSYGKGKPTEPSLPLLVPVLMEGRRAGSSDALLWSQKTLSPDEKSLRSDSSRKLLREQQLGSTNVVDSSIAQEEEEPLEYKNVKIIRDSFYNVYEKKDELGKGRFGVVYEVVHKVSKKSYAGKIVKCIKAKDKERVQLEVKIMNDLGYHPKLICLIDAFEMPREIVIVTQRIDGGELFERVVADDFTLTEGDCIIFLRQICDAVRFIHAKNIMHLDLKPENILCTSKESNLIKIIDFGLAQYYDSTEPIRVLFGTAEFVSPEIINYEPIAPSTDNWSVGVITYILLSGLSPFMGDNDNETFSNITRAEFDFDDEAFEKISDDAKDFITNLIVKRPEKRMTAEQSLSHRWLKQESVDCKKDVILSTDKLKRFLVRRKWQKTGNAIRALSRMTTLYSRRSSSASSTTPTGSLSISSPPPPSYRSGTSTLHESTDDNVFFPHAATSPDNDNNLSLNNNINQPVVNHLQQEDVKSQSLINATTSPRAKFADPARSDSGICDVGSFSSSLNYD